MALENQKWESFARFVATGMTIAKSYVSAGYSSKNDNTANASGQKLLRNRTIRSRVTELRADHHAMVQARVAAKVEADVQTRAGRVAKLIDDLDATDRIIAERAKLYGRDAEVPGGSTGHVVIDYRVVGAKTPFEAKLKVHSVDVALMRERRAILDQVAVELGQRVLKTESVKRKSIEEMTMEELRELAGEMDRAEQNILEERRVGGSQVQ